MSRDEQLYSSPSSLKVGCILGREFPSLHFLPLCKQLTRHINIYISIMQKDHTINSRIIKESVFKYHGNYNLIFDENKVVYPFSTNYTPFPGGFGKEKR